MSRRKRPRVISNYVLSLVLTLIAGGEGLEGTRLLREDGGLQGWLWRDYSELRRWRSRGVLLGKSRGDDRVVP